MFETTVKRLLEFLTNFETAMVEKKAASPRVVDDLVHDANKRIKRCKDRYQQGRTRRIEGITRV